MNWLEADCRTCCSSQGRAASRATARAGIGKDRAVATDLIHPYHRTILSDASIGSGPGFVSPRGIAVEADGSLVVVDIGLEAVVRVDQVSGDRTIISDASIGSGPGFCFVQHFARIDPAHINLSCHSSDHRAVHSSLSSVGH